MLQRPLTNDPGPQEETNITKLIVSWFTSTRDFQVTDHESLGAEINIGIKTPSAVFSLVVEGIQTHLYTRKKL